MFKTSSFRSKTKRGCCEPENNDLPVSQKLNKTETICQKLAGKMLKPWKLKKIMLRSRDQLKEPKKEFAK